MNRLEEIKSLYDYDHSNECLRNPILEQHIKWLIQTVEKQAKALEKAIGALKSTVGYEPFKGSLDPYKSSETLTKIQKIMGELK